MHSNIFTTMQNKAEDVQKAQKSFDRHLREAVRLLMASISS